MQKGKYIYNSLAGLNYLKKNNKSNKCYLKKVSIRINEGGCLDPCGVLHYNNFKDFNLNNYSFSDIYKEINSNIHCNYNCWCTSRIEFNQLLSFKFDTIFNTIKHFFL